MNQITHRSIFLKYVKTLFSVSILVFSAHFLSLLLNTYHFFNETAISAIQDCSIIFVAATVYGRPGWKIQSWSGDNSQEILNDTIFNWLSGISFFFAVLSFHLKV